MPSQGPSQEKLKDKRGNMILDDNPSNLIPGSMNHTSHHPPQTMINKSSPDSSSQSPVERERLLSQLETEQAHLQAAVAALTTELKMNLRVATWVKRYPLESAFFCFLVGFRLGRITPKRV